MSDKNKDSTPTDKEVIQAMLPLRMTSTVVHGFGRGSTDLGIPTANLDRIATKVCRSGSSHSQSPSFENLPTGIYWGFARIVDNEQKGMVYKTAVSIGYNPTYGNEQKTVEPHFIAPPTDACRHASSCGETLMGEFYDKHIRLSVVGYLRPELPFEGLENLIQAIKHDIVDAENLGDSTDASVQKEHEWVASDDAIIE